MGRISSVLIKRTGNEILSKFSSEFKLDYAHNKKALDTVATMTSKKLKNVIAGYITRKIKQKSKK